MTKLNPIMPDTQSYAFGNDSRPNHESPFQFSGLNLQDVFEEFKSLFQARDRVQEPTLPQTNSSPSSSSSAGSSSTTSSAETLHPKMAIPMHPSEYQDISLQEAWDSMPANDRTAILNVMKNPASAKNASGTPPKAWVRADGKNDKVSQEQLAQFQSKTLPLKSVEVSEIQMGELFSVKSIRLYTITPEKGAPFQIIFYELHPCMEGSNCTDWKYNFANFYEGVFSMHWKFVTDTFSSNVLFYNTDAAPQLQMSTPNLMSDYNLEGSRIVPGQPYPLNGDSLLKEYFIDAPKPDGNFAIELPNDSNSSEPPVPVAANPESSPTQAPTLTQKTVIQRNPTLNFTAPVQGDNAIIWNRFGDLAQANIRNNDILAVAWQSFDLISNTPFPTLVSTTKGSTLTIAGIKFNITETQPLTLVPEANEKWQYKLEINYNLSQNDGSKFIEVFIKNKVDEEIGKLRASWIKTGDTKSNYQIALETFSKSPTEEAYEFTGYFSADLSESDYWVVSSPNTQGFAMLWLNGKNKDKNFKHADWKKVQERFMSNSPSYKSSIVWKEGLGNTWESNDDGVAQTTIGRDKKAKETKSEPAQPEPAAIGLTPGPALALGARIGLNNTTTNATSDFKSYPEDSSSQGLGVNAQAFLRGGYFFTPNWGLLGEVALGYDLRQSAFVEHSVSTDWNAYVAARLGVWQFGLGGGISPQYALKREGAITTPHGYTITSPEYLSAWSTSPQAAAFASWRILTLGAEYEFSSTNVAEDAQYITGLRTSNFNVWAGLTFTLK